MKGLYALVGIFVLCAVAAVALFLLPSKSPTPTDTTPRGGGEAVTPQPSGIPDLIVVDAPRQNATVSSPITITGTARGPWYFEASFPVELRDASGVMIAQGHGQAQGEWMTGDFVPFSATLTYPAQPAGAKGTLILRNDNPSGDPARDKSVEISVVFQ